MTLMNRGTEKPVQLKIDSCSYSDNHQYKETESHPIVSYSLIVVVMKRLERAGDAVTTRLKMKATVHAHNSSNK